MKTLLLSLSFMLLSFYSSSQNTTSTKKNYEKEISLSYVVVYPDEFLPSFEFSIRKIISPSFHIGAGITEIYFRYRKRMYIPVFADAGIYFGKKKKLGLSIQPGYGFYNYTWDNGNTFIKEKGSFYLSFGPKYSFDLKNKKLNCSVNLVNPITRERFYVVNTQKSGLSSMNHSGINIKVGFVF